jgi:hypothetical protein
LAPKIEVAPALEPPAVDLAAELPAARADTPPTAQPDGDDHPLGAERDVDHGRPGRRSIRLNPVVTRTSPSFASR